MSIIKTNRAKFATAILALIASATSFGQTVTVYEGLKATWTSNTSASVNPTAADSFSSAVDPISGNLIVSNTSTKEFGGGLVSTNFAVPANAKHFGFDVMFYVSPDDFGHYARGENDLKITFQGGAQANGSCQWNADVKQWDLDPTGKTWVHTGYTAAPVVGWNKLQIRVDFDGAHWSVTGLRVNDDATPFVPGAAFQNLPAINSGWGAGLHPQLQTEATHVPFVLRVSYSRVRVLASDGAIPWNFD